MEINEKYMSRCLQLALNGKGFVNPNPMVGAVIVHNGKIIGEGFHRLYGEAHAEVNAINNVKDKRVLKESTMYVSLEPCSHFGKTPPCAQLIIDNGIKNVVIACLDPYPAVSGKGVKMLEEAGIKVTTKVMEEEALELNKEFITCQTKRRPYIYLKWAQTKDGFIDKIRDEASVPSSTPISGSFTRMMVHKKRAETASIMVGTNTAINDNPSLTTRYWYGNNPVRIVIDRMGRIPRSYNLFDEKVMTVIFTEGAIYENSTSAVIFKQVKFDEFLFDRIFTELADMKINSVMVEGGGKLLQSLIEKGLWDEAYIEIADISFEGGVKGPWINATIVADFTWGKTRVLHLSNR